MQRLQSAAFARNRLQLFLLFWVIVSLLYLPAWKGGFQQDFHGWLQIYTDDSFWDCINRRFAGIRSFYQVTQLQLYFWTYIFGTHPLPWFLLFTGLHALNGMLLCRLCAGIFEDFSLPAALPCALLGTTLFLIAPGMTETVLWKACYHYLIGLQIMLWCLTWCRQWVRSGNPRWAWLSLALFIPATATLETWYIIPWAVLLLGLAYRLAGITYKARNLQMLARFFLPMMGIFIAYLLLYHYRYGIWVAHSAYKPGEKNGFADLASRFWIYEFHLLGFGRFFSNGIRNWVYDHIGGSSVAALPTVALVVGFGVYTIIRYPRSTARFRGAALLAGWAVLALIVVLHFPPERLFFVANDRYLYFTGAFQYSMIGVLAGVFWARRRAWGVIAAFLVLLNGIATAKLVLEWRHSNKVFWGIQDNFRWADAPAVILLNLPATYNGVGIINAHKPDDFSEHLRIFYGQPQRNNVYDVASYNMQQPWDGVHVTALDSTHLKVTLNQWGSWWTFGGLGAVDFSNDLFDVRFTDVGHEYLLTLKKPPPGTVILYQQGTQWRVVDLQKRDEQW